MATGKKGKKAKWIPANITDIIAEPTTLPTTNWADQVDEEEHGYGSSRPSRPIVLPSASRAARGGLAVDDESIPKNPPYVAYISNLPYDVDENAITQLFAEITIKTLRLPRDGERLKGYGYVDFNDRQSLVDAMNIPDLTISNRRIRIEVSTHDNEKRMGNNRGGRNDRDRDSDPDRTLGDWRSGPRDQPRPPPSRERERDREYQPREEVKPGAWRDDAAAPRPYGGRDSYGRDNSDRDRGYNSRDGADRGGYGRDRYGGRDSGGGNRSFGERRGYDRDRESPAPLPKERPKLNLLPRTLPLPEQPAPPPEPEPTPQAPRIVPTPAPAAKVFGSAKPVDTLAKELEIEERLKREREEESKRNSSNDRDRWPKKNDSFDDRRAPRRDGGGYRDNRDRRDKSGNSYDRESRGRDRDYRSDTRNSTGYNSRESSHRDGSRDKRDYPSDEEKRNSNRQKNNKSNERLQSPPPRKQVDDDKPLPQYKESEPTIFAASNKFSCLEDDGDTSN